MKINKITPKKLKSKLLIGIPLFFIFCFLVFVVADGIIESSKVIDFKINSVEVATMLDTICFNIEEFRQERFNDVLNITEDDYAFVPCLHKDNVTLTGIFTKEIDRNTKILISDLILGVREAKELNLHEVVPVEDSKISDIRKIKDYIVKGDIEDASN